MEEYGSFQNILGKRLKSEKEDQTSNLAGVLGSVSS
jgi:hypothetical protein